MLLLNSGRVEASWITRGLVSRLKVTTLPGQGCLSWTLDNGPRLWPGVTMLSGVCVILVLTLGQAVLGEEAGYRSYKLVKVDAPSELKLRAIVSGRDWVDVFSSEGVSLTAMVPPQHLAELIRVVKSQGGKITVLHEDMQKVADEEYRERMRHRRRRAVTTKEQDLLTYLDLDKQYAFQDKVLSGSSNAHMVKERIGRSSEKRDINLIRISADASGQKKRTIFIDAGIHAREWIAPATANYILYQLAYNASSAGLLRDFNWEIVPVLNPDGYRYSHVSSRYWRKNRQGNTGSPCIGTDLNRNFGYPQHMPSAGGSSNPCSDIYSGPSKFSAPESRVLKNYLDSHNDTIVAYLSLHSFGRYILYPWGYSLTATPSDAAELERVAQVANRAMSNDYITGSSAKALYVAAGGSDDYAKGGAKIDYSYTIELPPGMSSRYNFAPPTSSIPGYTGEAWDGVQALARELAKVTAIAAPTTTKITKTTTTTQKPIPVQSPYYWLYQWLKDQGVILGK
ncbi:carboxypeptidase B-like isoform X1 [Haliotis cracherodii]|uniref:carboxypeptidase B-like isoform X1 n=2 Tax=Haliotis cracherodii TaxID=6455 RepID=UPI0039ED2D22